MASIGAIDSGSPRLSFAEKLWGINWGLILLLTVIACFGFAMLYSAANGALQPWAGKQMLRYAVSLALMLIVAIVDIRFWLRAAYVVFAIGFVLLVAVEVRGAIGMGAQRWIDLGIIQLQPSELMKVALVLALARYFHGLTIEEVGKPLRLIMPALLILTPAVLVLKQPDLGTAMMLLMSGGVVFFLAGVRLWKFGLVIGAGAAAMPFVWAHMKGYQRNRILTFLDPENDPQGAGYHILQSKIALGSGGVFGKGFLLGTQSHLNFLPEKQTDFIFTMLAEELGLIGGLALLTLYTLVFIYGFAIALRSHNHFGRLLGLGITVNFFLYVFINTAMVMGLIPVVGVPLPLISYGGTSMLTVMFGFGLLMSAYIHRDVRIGRFGESD
ncbi:MAG: rod shape-determining protein RodA [Rhodospirillales bacterium]|jgi:rod shape determining protein RodA|nr:rod shape-determining protein RodA [Rhodospirillales bacterium]